MIPISASVICDIVTQSEKSRDFVMLSEDLHNQTLSVKKCHKIYFSVATNNARIEIEKNLLNKQCHKKQRIPFLMHNRIENFT